jgi:hypothetical protein
MILKKRHKGRGRKVLARLSAAGTAAILGGFTLIGESFREAFTQKIRWTIRIIPIVAGRLAGH